MKLKDSSAAAAASTYETIELELPKRRLQIVLEDDAIRIRVPIRMRHRNNRREAVVTFPEEPPAPQEALVRTVARAHHWQELLESGEVDSISALATRFDVDHSYVARTLRLASLAPDIVEAIVRGDEPDGLSLDRLMRPWPARWDEQRAELGARWIPQ